MTLVANIYCDVNGDLIIDYSGLVNIQSANNDVNNGVQAKILSMHKPYAAGNAKA